MTDQHFDVDDQADTAGDWFAAGRGVMQHPTVGEDAPTPAPADPSRRAWTYAEAWMFGLVENAAFRRHVRRDVNGIERPLDSGQILASRRYLARKFNWSEKAVRVFVGKLILDGMVAVSKGPAPPLKRGQGKGQGSNVLTLCNYEKFQPGAKAKGQGKGQPPPHSGATIRNNKLKQPPYPQRGPGQIFDDRKRGQRQRIAEAPNDACQLPQWQNVESLKRLDNAPVGPVSRYVRGEVERNGWDRAVFGPAPSDGEDNPLFEFLDPADLARWGGRPAPDDVDPSEFANVVRFAPRARPDFAGAPL